MSYTSIFSRAWQVIRRNPHIPILYIGALLISDVVTFLIGQMIFGPAFEWIVTSRPDLLASVPAWAIPHPLFRLEQMTKAIAWIGSFGPTGWVSILISLLVILILAGCLYVMALGGVIASGADVLRGQISSTSAFIKAGIRGLWRMLVLISFTAIPLTLAGILVVIIATAAIQGMGGLSALQGDSQALSTVTVIVACATLILVAAASLTTMALALWVPLAYRAAILEQMRPVAAMRRAKQVIMENVGNFLILLIITLAVGMALGIALSIPNRLALIFHPIQWITLTVSGFWQTVVIVAWTAAWLDTTSARDSTL